MNKAKKLVIVAEDHVALSVAQFLKPDPVQLFRSHSGEEALAVARRERPDVVLLDSDLPGFDAAGCCAAFKADDALCDTPIIALASSGNTHKETMLSEAGCDDFLDSPLRGNRLLAKLRHYVSCSELFVRIPYYTQVTIRDKSDVYYGMTGDISVGGVYIATFDRLPEDGEIEIRFTLEKGSITQIVTKGRVAWLNSKSDPRCCNRPEGFGVEFTNIPDEKLLAIEEYIADEKDRLRHLSTFPR